MFICLEGSHGAGKSTQCLLLKERLERETEFPIAMVKAVGNNKLMTKKFIKDLNLTENTTATRFILLALYSKQAHEAHLALKEKQIVLADRWKETFYAYNDQFWPLSSNLRDGMVNLAFNDLDPDITILLDVKPEIAERNYIKRGKIKSFHASGLKEPFNVFKYEREHYLKVASRRKNWSIVNGEKTVQEVHESIWALISSKLK
jgi:dTMP kinase